MRNLKMNRYPCGTWGGGETKIRGVRVTLNLLFFLPIFLSRCDGLPIVLRIVLDSTSFVSSISYNFVEFRNENVDDVFMANDSLFGKHVKNKKNTFLIYFNYLTH